MLKTLLRYVGIIILGPGPSRPRDNAVTWKDRFREIGDALQGIERPYPPGSPHRDPDPVPRAASRRPHHTRATPSSSNTASPADAPPNYGPDVNDPWSVFEELFGQPPRRQAAPPSDPAADSNRPSEAPVSLADAVRHALGDPDPVTQRALRETMARLGYRLTRPTAPDDTAPGGPTPDPTSRGGRERPGYPGTKLG